MIITREQVKKEIKCVVYNILFLKGFTLLRTSEEMIETLEENQVQLQSMMVSKFVGYFFNEISGWQKTLGVVDQVSPEKGHLISALEFNVGIV